MIIFADGCPGMPGNKKVQEFVSKKGYWSFFPRYCGTWESGGQFLDHSPHEDILAVVDGVSKPIIAQWDQTEYLIENPEIYIVGASFGGTAAILCAADPRVSKVIALAPVTDWREEEKNPTFPVSECADQTRRAFGTGYRFDHEDWRRLSRGEFYNPIDEIQILNKEKILIIHAMDDDVVLYEPVQEFAEKLGCKLITLKKGGHLGTSALLRWPLNRNVFKFLSS